MRGHMDYPGDCPGCGAEMRLKVGTFGFFWSCNEWPGCTFAVGCHPHTTKPLGTPANFATRKARKAAHDLFDQTWIGPRARMSRKEAYAWLASRMGLPVEQTHIALFDAAQCQEVITHAQCLLEGGGLATIGEALEIKAESVGEH
jgi:ssDNA-binding Zn-finger/Zn-ribbon topoisomerase 1